MRHLAKAALLFVFGALPAVCMAKGQESVIPCTRAAFSRRGDLVAITANGQTLDLEIIRGDGARESGRATIRTDQYGDVDCSVFVSSDGNLAAVVTRVPLHDGESVRVWDLAAAEWRSSFHIPPRAGLEGRIAVSGFLNGGPNLLVVGRREGKGDASSTWMTLDLSGATVLGPTDFKTPALIDPRHNRVWIYQSSRLWSCSMRAIALVGKSVTGPSIRLPPTQAEDCTSDFFGFPDANTIVGAAGKGNGGTWVWTLDLASGHSSKLLLPSPRKQFLDRWVDSGPAELEVSPNGKFFAVDVQVTRWSHFDTQRAEWSELHVFQVAPLREIAKLGPKKGCGSPTGFAVGDADGKAHVAANWCGKWSTETVSDFVLASHR